MSTEPIVIGDNGIVPDFHVNQLKRRRDDEKDEPDLYNDNNDEDVDHESKRARLNSEPLYPLKSSGGTAAAGAIPFTDVTVTGSRSSYTLRVMDLESHYLLCGLNTERANPSYASTTGGPLVFPKFKLFTSTDVVPPPAEILERFMPIWREHNSRESGALCVFDHFAWLLFLAESISVLPPTLDLDKHYNVIEAYVEKCKKKQLSLIK